MLAAVALSQIAPVTKQAGHYLASMRPVASRLKALLAKEGLVPETERGNLHHALGMAYYAIGDQEGVNETP